MVEITLKAGKDTLRITSIKFARESGLQVGTHPAGTYTLLQWENDRLVSKATIKAVDPRIHAQNYWRRHIGGRYHIESV